MRASCHSYSSNWVVCLALWGLLVAPLVACGEASEQGELSPQDSSGSALDAQESVIDAATGTSERDLDTEGDAPGPPEQSTCEGKEDGVPCEDGNVCTTEDVCTQGICAGGVNLICDEGGACSVGSCDPAQGCVYDPLADGDACEASCFGAASCQSGECVVDPDTAVICPSPDSPCVDQLSCDPASGECSVEIYRPEGDPCNSDDDLCTEETCDGAGACVDTGETETCADENEDNPCWTYTCNAKSGCVQTNFVEGLSCDDNNACTLSDTCTLNRFGQETCVGEAADADDQNPCTDDACVPSDDGLPTFVHTPIDGQSCVSSGACALPGTCQAGECVTSGECACASDSDCTQPEDLCEGTIVCLEGQCVIEEGSPVVCPPSEAPCGTTLCDPATGSCVAGEALDDQSPCAPTDTTCSDSGTCQAGACVPDALCECESDADCAPPEDKCAGVMVCNADKACELDTTQAVTCPPSGTPCEGSVCSPETGQCNPISFVNGTECTPSESTCGDTGTCQMGVCEPTGVCPTAEAVYVLHGLDATLKRSFDEGDTWEDVSVLPIPAPTLPALSRGGAGVLYVTTYFNASDAAEAGYEEGNQLFRSDDAGVSWTHLGGWSDGSSASAVCAGSDPNLLFVTDTLGAIRRSEDGGATLPVVGNWQVQGAMVDCVVAPSGALMLADALYCGDPTEDGCAAIWISSDAGVTATPQGNYVPDGLGNKAALTVGPTGTLWAIGGDHDVYTSLDAGQTWTLAGTVPSLKGLGDITASDSGALYAGTPTSACSGECDPATASGEFYVSKDGGATWGKSASYWTEGGSGSGWMTLVTSQAPIP